MTKLPARLPSALSERITGAAGSIFTRQGREVDCALGGIPFRLATYAEEPLTIETIPVRKDQLDTEVDPGEQSLSGWWRRSQASFHQGAGFRYEPSGSNESHEGFWDSSGVDVFTPGQLKLIRKMSHAEGGITGHGVMSKLRTYGVDRTRQNLCQNPSFETNTTSWGASAGGGPGSDLPTLSRVDAFSEGFAPLFGQYVGKIAWGTDDGTGTSPHITVPIATMAAGTEYTVSIYVRTPTGDPKIQVEAEGVVGTNGSPTNDWARISVTATTVSGTPSVVITPVTPVDTGDIAYIDACLVEEGSVVDSYFDGDSALAAWDGAADNSTSTMTNPGGNFALSAVEDGVLVTVEHSIFSIPGTTTDIHAPVGETIVDGLVTGDYFYSIDADSTLYEGTLASPGTATTWPLTATATDMAWGKHRLWIIGGRRIWQPDLTLAGASNQNPIFTNPNQGWTYTSIAEGASAMYFAGHDGFTSSIQAITLDSDGTLPTLSGAAVTAQFPDGEFVQQIVGLAGQFIGIGTNQGFRVGVVGANQTTIAYGPLMIEPEGVQECTALTTQGKFFLVSFRTESGEAVAYRVDTSTELSDGVFAYAKDVENEVGAFTSLTTSRGQVFGIADNGAPWFQSETEYVDEGWIQSSRIRYRTTEFKIYKYLDLDIDPLEGSVQVDLITDTDTTLSVGNLTTQGEVFNDTLEITHTPMKHAAVKLTMVPEGTASPTVNGFLLRAIPAVTPQRMITIPLLCFDYEQSRSGMRYGGKGYAMDRLLALQTLEDSAESFIFQNFSDGTGTGVLVVIERLQFRQTQPSTGDVEGAGGVLVAQLRTVEA